MKKLLEIALYEIFDLLPNLVLAILPFRNYLRFSKKVAVLSVVLMYVFMVFSRCISMSNNVVTTIMTVGWVVLYLVFYRLSVRMEWPKLLFVLLIILNYNSCITIVLSYFCYSGIPQETIRIYSAMATLCLIVIQVPLYPAVYYVMEKKVSPLVGVSDNNSLWNYMWLVPAVFCSSYYYNIFANGGVAAFAGRLSNVLFAAGYNLGAFFVCWIILKLMEESNVKARLKAENYQLTMQFIQYEHLKTRMEEARRARHDFRQSMAVIQAYVNDNDKDALQNYLRRYLEEYTAESIISYSDNYALNALLVYYEEITKKYGITFQADIDYPEKSGIADSDIIVLTGNLLENAMDACLNRNESGGYLMVRVKRAMGAIVIQVENPYTGRITVQNEEVLSLKEDHSGIGILSVKEIAQKYHGTTQFDWKDKIFKASVLLCPE